MELVVCVVIVICLFVWPRSREGRGGQVEQDRPQPDRVQPEHRDGADAGGRRRQLQPAAGEGDGQRGR